MNARVFATKSKRTVTSETPPPASDQHNSTYQQVTRSGRRLTRGRQWLYRLGIPIALGLIRLLWASYRIRRIAGDQHLDIALGESGAIIPCLWHQHLMLGVPYLLGKRELGLKLGVLISPSVDGEAGAILAQRLGGYVIRGSGTYTGARALRDFYIAVSKDKVSPLVTPDGPTGPRYVAKSGALLIAQLTGKPIIPIAFAASRVFKFRAWDRFILPLPFARIVIAVGKPINVPKVINPGELDSMQLRLAEILRQLFTEAARELNI